MLELKANPQVPAVGAIIEAALKKTAALEGEIDAQATFEGILQLLGEAIITLIAEGWLEKYPFIEAVMDRRFIWKAFLEGQCPTSDIKGELNNE